MHNLRSWSNLQLDICELHMHQDQVDFGRLPQPAHTFFTKHQEGNGPGKMSTTRVDICKEAGAIKDEEAQSRLHEIDSDSC